MSVIESVRRQLVPIHPQGYIFIAAFAAATLFLAWVWAPLGWLAFVATLWCVYFFRDPARMTPLAADLVIAPADGVISFAGLATPPPELGLGAAPLQRLSVFMSVFDCHVNRAPVEGRVRRVVYHPGAFLSADLDKASEANERNGVVIENAAGVFGVADRRPRRAAHRLLHPRRGASHRRRPHRPYPLRLAGRCLSAGGRADRGRSWRTGGGG
jgi:phosphatidylserine decarboxylase